MISKIDEFCIKSARKIYKFIHPKKSNSYSENWVELYDQEANDYVARCITECFERKKGLMISKFGTIELNNICSVVLSDNPSMKDRYNCVVNRISLFPDQVFDSLCNNAGFFPQDISLLNQYVKLTIEDLQEIDILGSYIWAEKYLEEYLQKSVKINLNGYYAPYLWVKPWTRFLEGKKVMVIHPFVETIKQQYKKRDVLFDDKDVLPEFQELILIKAVQSMAGNGKNTGFDTWFDALQDMKNEIDKYDFDVALIGCGAYGMNLAAYVKRKGKIAIHLAGWTQMLFGIYGKRWIEDQPQYSKFINEHWVRPGENERPKNAESVEGACYW